MSGSKNEVLYSTICIILYTYISNNVRYKLYTNVFWNYSLFSKSYTIPASLASRCSAGPAKGRQPRGKVSRGPGGACPNLVLHNLRNLKKKSCCVLKRVRVVLLGFQTQGLCIPAFHERCEAASGPNDFDSFSFDNSMTVRSMRTFEAIYKHMQAFRIALETRNFIKSSHCLHSEEMLFNN